MPAVAAAPEFTPKRYGGMSPAVSRLAGGFLADGLHPGVEAISPPFRSRRAPSSTVAPKTRQTMSRQAGLAAPAEERDGQHQRRTQRRSDGHRIRACAAGDQRSRPGQAL